MVHGTHNVKLQDITSQKSYFFNYLLKNIKSHDDQQIFHIIIIIIIITVIITIIIIIIIIINVSSHAYNFIMKFCNKT